MHRLLVDASWTAGHAVNCSTSSSGVCVAKNNFTQGNNVLQWKISPNWIRNCVILLIIFILLTSETLFFSLWCTHSAEWVVFAYLLSLLHTGHVLFGQAGAVQGLLWIFSVALEHLGLQVSAHRHSLPGPGDTGRRGGVSVITTHSTGWKHLFWAAIILLFLCDSSVDCLL